MSPHKFSDYIVYVDESGDHGLESIDPSYPMFVLSFCIFKKAEYSKIVTSALQSFKFKYFGYDTVVLHEHEIRKSKNHFQLLFNQNVRKSFMEDLNKIIEIAPFTIIATVIKKLDLRDKYHHPINPYHIALSFGLERIYYFLDEKGQTLNTTHIVFEKRINSGGLQLADLTARPIALSFLRPNQKNRAYEIIEKKFRKNEQGKKNGWGLKCFP